MNEACPAFVAFRRDDRRTLSHVKAYEYCRDELDFVEMREVKLDPMLAATGLNYRDAIHALDDLRAWGYLREGKRGFRGIRRLALNWSVHPRNRQSLPKRQGSVA